MKYKYVGTDIDVPDNFEEWHIKLLLYYDRIYETPRNNTQTSPVEKSLNKDLTATQQVATPKEATLPSVNSDIMFNKKVRRL